MHNIFSTRELSIGIWLIIAIIWMLLYKPTRKCLIDLFKNVCSFQLSIPFFFMIAYTLGISYVFYRTSFWNSLFIKDIVLWVIFVGTPLFFGAININLEEHYFKKIIISNFKFTVLIEFFVSSFTFPLIWEIILVPILVFTFMLDTITSIKNEYRPVKRLISAIIIIINIVFIYETISVATSKIGTFYEINNLITLLIPIVLSVLYIPISYIFTVLCKYQIIFIRIKFKEPKDHAMIQMLHRLKIIWTCKFSLSNLCKFESSYIQHMYVSMNEVEFDKLMHRFKIENSNIPFDCKYTKEEKKLMNQLKEDTFQKKIEYMNAHIGIFTLLFTLAIGLISIILKGFVYVYICGKFDYWGISHTYINISNENILYETLLFAAVAVIYIASNYIPFTILTSKKAWYKRLFNIVILLMFTAGVLSVFFLLNDMVVYHNFILDYPSIFQLAKESLILTVLWYLIGLLFSISFRAQKDKSKNQKVFLHKFINLSTLFILILGISLYIILAYAYGRDMATNQKSYKTIDNNCIVIYESVEYFIVSDYEVINNTLVIDSTVQTLINKENIKTETKIFDKLERKNDK